MRHGFRLGFFITCHGMPAGPELGDVPSSWWHLPDRCGTWGLALPWAAAQKGRSWQRCVPQLCSCMLVAPRHVPPTASVTFPVDLTPFQMQK